MAFDPDSPFPKTKGDDIRAKDWNDLVDEARRLDTEVKRLDNESKRLDRELDGLDTRKLNRSGGTVSGRLTVNSSLGVGTTPAVKLHVRGNRIRLEKANGTQTLDLRSDGNAVDIQSNNSDLFINNNNRPVRIRNLINSSSRQWKEEITELSGREATEALEALRPLSFVFKGDDARQRHLGFVAEEVPESTAAPDRKGFSPTAIIAVLTRVVQDQQQQLEALRGELAALKAKTSPSGKGRVP